MCVVCSVCCVGCGCDVALCCVVLYCVVCVLLHCVMLGVLLDMSCALCALCVTRVMCV